MGHVFNTLAQRDLNTRDWPYIDRLIIEDCETIHIHLNNMRMEFTRGQFLELVEVFQIAAETLRKVMAEDENG